MRTLLAVTMLLAVLGCSQAPKPQGQCDVQFGQDDATARAWADANQAAKEARP